jgi:hypothetical protein
MRIINVNKQFQDQFTREEDIELIDGEKKYWFTCTSLYTEERGGYEKFLQEIEKRVKEKNYRGIYLYKVGTYERPKNNNPKEIEVVWYISWDFFI